MDRLPIGKLPPKLLHELLRRHTPTDPRVLLGPGIGLDCAVLDFDDILLVVKSDPITFTEEEIGWYAVHVNANDIVTTGASPRWFLATLLLPEERADRKMTTDIFDQIGEACESIGAQLIGGHTEITTDLDRPIVVGTMLGEVERERLITPQGARPGDLLLLTKGVPIEATSILAREFPERLADLPAEVVSVAREFLHQPGISVVTEALAAAGTGAVTAMHDPTEGGLASGLWELAEAANVRLVIDKEAIFVPAESSIICESLAIDPLEAIASGALLLSSKPEGLETVCDAIEDQGVHVSVIGQVAEGHGVAMRIGGVEQPLLWPPRDALTRVFEETPPMGGSLDRSLR
jgi:hydrogenase expression/formation protein HypE